MALKFNFTTQQLVEYENLQETTLKRLERWCQTQPIPQPSIELVALFLIACDGDVVAAKTTILAYYRIKNAAVDIFNERSCQRPEVRDACEIAHFCMMPRRTPDGGVVVCIKARRKIGGKRWSMRAMFKTIIMVLEAAIFEYPPKHFVIIFDVEHLTLKHLTKIKPKVVRVFLQYLQEGFPSKLKAIHVVNMVDILNKTVKALRPLIKMNVWEMTKFHSKNVDRNKFYHECVGPDYLPEELGGCSGSIELVHEITVQKLHALEDFFRAEELHRQVDRGDVVQEISESDESETS